MAKQKLDNDFDLVNLPIEAQDPEIKQEDFVLTKNDDASHEQKFQTKPTTFFKDSIKRFAKNKSSVVAAVLLGILIVLSIFVPIFDRYDNTVAHADLIYLTPKLFPSGTGFWDGSIRLKGIAVDISADPEGTDKEANWWPSTKNYKSAAVSNKSFSEAQYTNSPSEYAVGGYLRFYYTEKMEDEKEFISYRTENISYLSLYENHYLSVLDIYDADKMKQIRNESAPYEGSEVGEAAFYVYYHDNEMVDGDYVRVEKKVEILPFASTQNIGSEIASLSEPKINLTQKLLDSGISYGGLNDVSFAVALKNSKNHKETSVYIKNVQLETDSTDASLQATLKDFSFDNPSQQCSTSPKNWGAINPWYVSGSAAANRTVYQVKTYTCDFTYDPYEAVYGVIVEENFNRSELDTWTADGVLDFYAEVSGFGDEVDPDTFKCVILDPDRCPLAEPIKIEDCHVNAKEYKVDYVKAKIDQYKTKNYDLGYLPSGFLFGTDKEGHDMLKYVFEGTRLSLILGVITSAVCFIFGLIWGAICGYFGGTVDLVMERFTDILSGVPWIVVMTLVIIKAGSSFGTFVLALCLTGWIGTAAITRTQFYRFRGREYVLASRTLGASDARLIAKHILPNAMGTIITSAVLMVPSVIFSEATLSYLNLGFRDLPSLGVTLSQNQTHLNTYPFLLIFPSVIIALLMICFNLFGNGLRDAVNPSLKGEGE